MTLPVSMFSAHTGLKPVKSDYSKNNLKAIQFGSNDPQAENPNTPSEKGTLDFLKDVGKELVKSPLPLWRRPLAFLNPMNWWAGLKAAKQTFGESKHKVLESLGLALDVGLSFLSFKVLFALNALFPNFMITETGKAFFRGIHQASADKLAARQAEAAAE